MQPSNVYCSRCGARNPPHAKSCYRCHHEIHPAHSLVTDTGKIQPGQVLNKRYEVVHLVGKGGMGAIYKAADLTLNRRAVAIKEMSQSKLQPEEIARATKMFEQEANLLAKLKHPNLPSILDYFEDTGRWYLAMDFIEGITLDERLSNAPRHVLGLQETLNIAIQLAKVLGYLHNCTPPIIFRDLKPLNIMLTSDDNVYLIDFGIARHFTPGKAKDTVYFVSQGYAAPEQYGSEQTSPQSGIYSLGVILHQMLSGKEPQLNSQPFKFMSLQTYNQNIPLALSHMVASMVHRDSAQRPASMAIVRQKLEQILMEVTQEGRQSFHEVSGRSTVSSSSPFEEEDDFEEVDYEPDDPYPQSERIYPSRYRQLSRPSSFEDEDEDMYDIDEDEGVYDPEPPHRANRRNIPPARIPRSPYDEDEDYLPNSRRPQIRQLSYEPPQRPSRPPTINRRPYRQPVSVGRVPRNSRVATHVENKFQDALMIGLFTGGIAFLVNLMNFSITISFYLPWLTRLDIIPLVCFLLAGFATGLITFTRSLGFLAGAIAGMLFITLALLLEPLKNSSSVPLYVSFLVFALVGGVLGLLGALLVTMWSPSNKEY